MRKRIKAIICSAISLILGGIGIQKFYLGQTKRGILYVLFCWTGIPYLLCIIDLIRFIFMSEKDFNLTYNKEYIENINYKNDSFEEKNYKNKFDDAIDIEYSYVDNNDDINKEEENNNKENIIINKSLEYHKLINNTIISIKDNDFSFKVKNLNQLFKCIIDKSKSSKNNERALKELDKMLAYNIPTTLKLINSYIDLSLKNTSDLQNIKSGIIESIESVTIYLNKVLENIEKDDILDITSDIDVLKAELKKDGYV
ncbi:TM2 domain-containing protein [Brachyspira hyodysenteriae]|uniref:TM2 domain-containing protein n=1 Tax=Brachyspira hyodysenteriae TaxID=159 RepID=UPI00063DAB87|nr:TM2 domain-containing protein [Brachyspira hyodysenteriae]KLI14307.1 membrane protein [Brachyspira hyodysenteriae]MDA0080263.1 TM2 domain-containing protein [Brachyspira hyodysenteriae]QTM08223.1 NINE protein [Brachyspira hyodysenteriae]